MSGSEVSLSTVGCTALLCRMGLGNSCNAIRWCGVAVKLSYARYEAAMDETALVLGQPGPQHAEVFRGGFQSNGRTEDFVRLRAFRGSLSSGPLGSLVRAISMGLTCSETPCGRLFACTYTGCTDSRAEQAMLGICVVEN